jgi:hypothetical protein
MSIGILKWIPVSEDEYRSFQIRVFYQLPGIYGRVAIFWNMGSFGKAELFMYEGVVSKCLSCFWIGGMFRDKGDCTCITGAIDKDRRFYEDP